MDLLISPVTFLLLLTLLFAALSRASRAAAIVSAICLFSCWAMCTPAAANWMVSLLESRVEASASCETVPEPDAVAVVLTGGVDRSPRNSTDVSALSKTSLERIEFAAEWVKNHPVKKLVISGGGPFQISESVVSEYLLRILLGDVRIPVVIESASKTTWDSAVNVGAMPIDRRYAIFLMTSRLHMPRSAMAFRSNGLRVCPIPTDSLYIKGDGPGYFFPQITAMNKVEAVLHEIIGIAYYKIRGAEEQDHLF